jgi:hypothetical protein
VGTTQAYLLRKVLVKAAHLARLLQHPGVQAKLANLDFRLADTRTTVRAGARDPKRASPSLLRPSPRRNCTTE